MNGVPRLPPKASPDRRGAVRLADMRSKNCGRTSESERAHFFDRQQQSERSIVNSTAAGARKLPACSEAKTWEQRERAGHHVALRKRLHSRQTNPGAESGAEYGARRFRGARLETGMPLASPTVRP